METITCYRCGTEIKKITNSLANDWRTGFTLCKICTAIYEINNEDDDTKFTIKEEL